MTSSYRIAIVGAASIRGKQLAEALAESTFAAAEFVLMDNKEALGQLETVGDEVTFIQPITADSFDRIDFTFFTSRTAESTRVHSHSSATVRLEYRRSLRRPGRRSRRARVRSLVAGSVRPNRSRAHAADSRPWFQLTPLRSPSLLCWSGCNGWVRSVMYPPR